MTIIQHTKTCADGEALKSGAVDESLAVNPALASAELALEENDLVRVDERAVEDVARYILTSMRTSHYTPRTWRTHTLHLLPPDEFDWSDPRIRATLDWIFLISSLNFSFWSEREVHGRYGVEWRKGWGEDDRVVWTGYWSLVAALDRALEEGIPITDPSFYSSPTRCPEATIAHVFRRADESEEDIPLLRERIAVMREVGAILVDHYDGSYLNFIRSFHRTRPHGTALDFVTLVTRTFPSFADECPSPSSGVPLCFWKRAQILTAETWAAFYPPQHRASKAACAPKHPIFPHGGIELLTMFADYRVPQILHHLGLLLYKPSLVAALRAHKSLAHGSTEEVAVRAGSIVAVERVVREMRRMALEKDEESGLSDPELERAGEIAGEKIDVCSVLVDFYLWDLAKRIEVGEEAIHGLQTHSILPTHRTRSIWY